MLWKMLTVGPTLLGRIRKAGLPCTNLLRDRARVTVAVVRRHRFAYVSATPIPSMTPGVSIYLDDTFEMPLQNCSMHDRTPFSAPPVHQLPSGPHHSHKLVCSALLVPPKYFGLVCPLLVCRNSVFSRVLAVLLDFYSDVKHACLFS